MFPRWLESLLTPCPRPVRALGYLDESLAIQDCYRHCCYAWQPHLRRTQDVIRAALARCAQRRKAVVLGSGMLSDVPLAELAATFREVVLVDIVHPRRVRRRLRQWPNVRLLAADVTGAVEGVFQAGRDPAAPLPRAEPDLFCADAEVDLVASVNLLPQLPYRPVAYLAGLGVHSDEAIAAFARGLIKAHLDYLPRLPGVVTLIADVEEVRLERRGRVIERTSTVWDVPLPAGGERWTWRLLPANDAVSGIGRHRTVVGIADVKQAGTSGAGSLQA